MQTRALEPNFPESVCLAVRDSCAALQNVRFARVAVAAAEPSRVALSGVQGELNTAE